MKRLLPLLILLFPPHAGGEGLDLDLFRPVPFQSDFLALHDSDLLPFGASTALDLDFNYNPLMILYEDETVSPFVRNALHGDFLLSGDLFGLLRLSLNLPVNLIVTGETFSPYSSIGDLALSSGIYPFTTRRRVWGIGFVPYCSLPTGNDYYFSLGGGWRYGGIVVADLRLPFFEALLNTGYDHVEGEAILENIETGDRIFLNAGLSTPLPGRNALSLELLSSTRTEGAYTNEGESILELLLSLRLNLPKGLSLKIGAGKGLTDTAGVPSYRLVFQIGMGIPGSIQDTDGDGIPDSGDRCPLTREDEDGFEDGDGCPDPDNDGDGLADGLDKCPAEQEDRDDFLDEDGCPETDNDGDGIPDDTDRCPLSREDQDGFEDEDGCPDKDNDQDRVADMIDRCPLKAEDYDGFQDEDGCPEADNDEDGMEDGSDECPVEKEDFDGFSDRDGCPDPDNDEDGLPDEVDRCPDKAENMNGFQDDDGCPEGEGVLIISNRIILPRLINFDLDSSILEEEDKALLNTLAGIIREEKRMKRIRIEGHCDDTGGLEYNDALSLSRAEVVKRYLVKEGVGPERLTVAGYGERYPLTSNTDEKSRRMNRRVEFTIMEME